MIVTSTPLRISFVGGGSDLPAFTDGPWAEEGAVVSSTIGLKTHVVINTRQAPGKRYRLSYSQTEEVDGLLDIKHDIIREALCYRLGTQTVPNPSLHKGIEITSIADVPYGTGLGSSSSFAVGLLHALHIMGNSSFTWSDLARQACHVEIDRCHKPIGRQDQYAAAFGGLTFYTFCQGEVRVEPIIILPEVKRQIQSNLLLLWTGRTRDASVPLKAQSTEIALSDSRERASIRAMANLAYALRARLQGGDPHAIGEHMRAAWALKKSLPGVADNQINHWCQQAASAGREEAEPFGVKLLGAGGGGCLLVYALKERHKDIIEATGLAPLPVELTSKGSTLVAKS